MLFISIYFFLLEAHLLLSNTLIHFYPSYLNCLSQMQLSATHPSILSFFNHFFLTFSHKSCFLPLLFIGYPLTQSSVHVSFGNTFEPRRCNVLFTCHGSPSRAMQPSLFSAAPSPQFPLLHTIITTIVVTV